MSTSLRELGTNAILSAGAAVGSLQTYVLPVRYNRGPEGRWWERVRGPISRGLGAIDERAGPRPITEGEFAGTFPGSLDDIERLLYDEGFVRNPFSRLKVRDGEPEVGSWVRRNGPFARRQLHVMLFANADADADGDADEDRVDVYAHDELSSVHPSVGVDHVDGTDQRVAAGVERARDLLPLDESDATVEPPAGAWDSGLEDGA